MVEPVRGMKESRTLGLDITKAKRELGWAPRLTTEEMLCHVVDFFKQQRAGIPEGQICAGQIRGYFEREAEWNL